MPIDRHPTALQTLFAETAERAAAQSRVFVTAPGVVVPLTKNGAAYLYWRTYSAAGKRVDEYIGRDGDPATVAKADELRARITEARELAGAAQTLRRAGYAAADNSAALTLATLFNARIFHEGAMLVGTHAFGALLNGLGVKMAANYRTEDVDIARYAAIQLAVEPGTTFVELLRQSGLHFIETPELDVRRPSSSFKVRGGRLRVDLLVPGDSRYRTVRVPELGAHATALPYLGYLLEERIRGAVLGRDHVIPVVLPTAARYAIHKAVVATLRAGPAPAKRGKDLEQAATLMQVLADDYPDELRGAAAALPATAMERFRKVLPDLLASVPDARNDVRDLLTSLATGRTRRSPRIRAP